MSAVPTATALPSWYDVSNFTGVLPQAFLASIAWDPNLGNGDLIYFGGCQYTGECPSNYTWSYDGFSWFNDSSFLTTAPPPIIGQSMDWDPQWDGIVMAGGGDLNGFPDAGTWLFTAGVWENITSLTGGLANSPPSVYGAMAWDPATQSIQYLDGCTNTTCGLIWGGLWSLGAPGSDWVGVPSFGFVYGESFAYDAADQEMISVGGSTVGYAQTNATWTLAGGTWTNRTASSVGCFFVCDLYPPGRSFASMTWDPQTDSILLFGGVNSTAAVMADSWQFTGNSWFPFQYAGAFSPPATVYNAMPANSSGFAPVMVAGECSCSGRTYTMDTPPTLYLSVVSPDPADVGANVSVTINGSAGAGSGPWLALGASYGNLQVGGSDIYGVNATTSWSYVQTGLSYPSPGTYAMSATITDFFYVGSTAYYNLTVVAGPTATVHATPANAEVGHAVSFNATVALGVAPYTYLWSFGDSTTST
ncbi:MAG: hypothetical protein L3K02_07520, partial [Thermoplasmata archaeon]|nr:hypothetical protein [Thermoplasmata archaeon]